MTSGIYEGAGRGIAKDEPATSKTFRAYNRRTKSRPNPGEPTSRKTFERIARNAPTSCFVDREEWRSAIGSALKVLVARAGVLHGVLGCGKVVKIRLAGHFMKKTIRAQQQMDKEGIEIAVFTSEDRCEISYFLCVHCGIPVQDLPKPLLRILD